MPTFVLACPSCNATLQAKLVGEVTPVSCDACGEVFLAQRPTAVNKKKKAKPKAAPEVPEPLPPPPPLPLSMALLEAADDSTSNAVIQAFAKSSAFKAFSKSEMKAIIARDEEDDEKLAQGIALAVDKGAVPPKEELPLEPTTVIDVLGLSADEVAGVIVAALGDAPSKGCVVVLQGLSGTGKGTTVAKLQQTLPKAASWSNGNIFRALTLLAVTYFESHGLTMTAEALSPALLADLVACLHFEQVSPAGVSTPVFDVRIDGLGIRAMVSQIANTLLKEPKVGANIPTVARVTQGEVIAFAAACAQKMTAAGMNVIMEGRQPTLQYVRTPYRFELTLSEPLIIGKRRAAQRIVGSAFAALRSAPLPSERAADEEADAVKAALQAALTSLHAA